MYCPGRPDEIRQDNSVTFAPDHVEGLILEKWINHPWWIGHLRRFTRFFPILWGGDRARYSTVLVTWRHPWRTATKLRWKFTGERAISNRFAVTPWSPDDIYGTLGRLKVLMSGKNKYYNRPRSQVGAKRYSMRPAETLQKHFSSHCHRGPSWSKQLCMRLSLTAQILQC